MTNISDDISEMSEASIRVGGWAKAKASPDMSDEYQVREVLAKSVRAADRRNSAEYVELFADDFMYEVVLRWGEDKIEQIVGPIADRSELQALVDHPGLAYAKGGWQHHYTHDHLVEVDGNLAKINAQYLVVNTQITGENSSTTEVGPSGYYDLRLKKFDGEWKITEYHVVSDVPWVLKTDLD
jgi:3-phenylpropionate/cinnamic acid dioxygenase small subunit